MLILINAVTLLIDETHLIFVPLHYPPGRIIIHQGKGKGGSVSIRIFGALWCTPDLALAYLWHEIYMECTLVLASFSYLELWL